MHIMYSSTSPLLNVQQKQTPLFDLYRNSPSWYAKLQTSITTLYILAKLFSLFQHELYCNKIVVCTKYLDANCAAYQARLVLRQYDHQNQFVSDWKYWNNDSEKGRREADTQKLSCIAQELTFPVGKICCSCPVFFDRDCHISVYYLVCIWSESQSYITQPFLMVGRRFFPLFSSFIYCGITIFTRNCFPCVNKDTHNLI